MQDVKQMSIPLAEMHSFLVAARSQGINSILLDDFESRIELLQKQTEFSELLLHFNPITTRVAIQILKNFNIISTYPYLQSTEITLSNPTEQSEVWESKTTKEERKIYYSIADAYRTTEIGFNKSPMIKRNS